VVGLVLVADHSLVRRTNNARFRGVTKHKRTQRYEAHIWECKKQIYLGGFDSEVLAAKSHGRFLNIVEWILVLPVRLLKSVGLAMICFEETTPI